MENNSSQKVSFLTPIFETPRASWKVRQLVKISPQTGLLSYFTGSSANLKSKLNLETKAKMLSVPKVFAAWGTGEGAGDDFKNLHTAHVKMVISVTLLKPVKLSET